MAVLDIGKVTQRKRYLDKKRDCVVCGTKEFDLWAQSGGFDAVQCRKCGLVFINPCLNQEGLKIVYAGHHKKRIQNDDECNKRQKMYEIDRDFLLEVISEGKILDIGCGGGFFLDKFDSKKWDRKGVEIDKDTVKFGKENFGVDIELWDSKTIPFADNFFDAIMFRGSFEHIVDPDIVVKEVKRVLKPNGFLYICATPNVDSFCARLYKEKWNQFDANEHIFMFSFKTLQKLIEPSGFKTVKSAAFYEETPYCDLENDIQKVLADYQMHKRGKREEMGISPAFWGNMLNIIFKKIS